ncbi:hypothetical protein GGI05_006442 [Coemansia sp. RSA 2603]|nr:hypothetical protein GGI05_006442 [Coemansia sp. RSA 2603]
MQAMMAMRPPRPPVPPPSVISPAIDSLSGTNNIPGKPSVSCELPQSASEPVSAASGASDIIDKHAAPASMLEPSSTSASAPSSKSRVTRLVYNNATLSVEESRAQLARYSFNSAS